MANLIDYILDLFRNPEAAAAYVADPEGAMRDAGVPPVSPAQFQAVAAAAAPAGVVMGGGDPVVGLQRAVADHHQVAQTLPLPSLRRPTSRPPRRLPVATTPMWPAITPSRATTTRPS